MKSLSEENERLNLVVKINSEACAKIAVANEILESENERLKQEIITLKNIIKEIEESFQKILDTKSIL